MGKAKRVRNWVAVAAHFRNNAGVMQGTRRARVRRERRDMKQALRRGVDN